ncbi:serine/threonine-protein kinase [Luteimicrobium subarcticum]|uniref:Serine/threonine protein kinase n=1 Tax=Luteimicrobium subarcticum TaxID=620910 RepID=A0A2M8WSP3_9MICO|nr:serine/threonine-protein kinase [Luteimicrobium subarcticum]PJI93977.1 serine/threonine protein kinase [Luteimicrobium subarcticum]
MTRRAVRPGDDVGGYTVVARLGSGANGSVFQAVDGGGTAVAVKVLHGASADDEVARARLAREAATLRRLDHPAVAEVLDVELDGEEPFIVTQLVDGRSLEDEVAYRGPFDAARLADLADALRDALEAVHAADVVHRDVKPSNIMCAAHGPVLVDFGIAHGLDDARLTSTGLVMGTPGYLAPEMLTGASPSQSTDWWGWAASLAFAATGRAPFGVTPVDAVLARAQTGAADLRGLGSLRRDALAGALDPDPAARWSPAEVVIALRSAARVGDDPTGTATQVIHRDGHATQVVPALTGAVSDGSTRAMAAEADAWTTAEQQPYDAATEVYAPYDATDATDATDGTAGTDGTGEVDDLAELGVGHVDRETADGGSGYERPVHRGRPWLGTALAAPFVAAAATWPVTTFGVLAVLVLLARYAGVATESLHGRRERRGVGRRDGARVVLASPWHLVRATIGSLPAVLVAAAAGVALVVVAWWALDRRVLVDDGGANAAWVYSVALVVTMVVAIVLAWFGPGARLTRSGVRVLLGRLLPTRRRAVVVGLLALAVAVGLAVPALTGHDVVWWPLPSGPGA